MHVKIKAHEAKTKLPELLRGVQSGNTYTITLRGKAVADLIPTQYKDNNDPAVAVDAMRKFMNSRKTIPDISLKNLIAEDRY